LVTSKFYVKNSKGINLATCLDSPENLKPSAYAVFAHCFTCSKELKSIVNINASLTKKRVAVLRFDMTGIGESEGDFSKTNFTSQIEDIVSVSDYLKEFYEAPKLLIGHSLGGSAAMFSAASMPSVRAVATIAAPSEPSNLSLKLKRTRERAFKEGRAETEIGGVKYVFEPQFFEDIEKYNMKEELIKFSKPLLIMHSPIDTYSHISESEIIFAYAKYPKSFVSLDNLDHLMLKRKDASHVGNLIAT